MSNTKKYDTAVVVAVQSTDNAKSRLSSGLSPFHRKNLVLSMLEDLLIAIREVHDGPLVIVTESSEYTELGERFGADIIFDDGKGFKEAAEAAILHISNNDLSDSIIILPGDLPQAQSSDLNTILEILSSPESNVLALSASEDGGTTALGIKPYATFSPQFGPDSASKHRDEANRTGMTIIELSLDSFKIDVDTIDDLMLIENTVGRQTRKALSILTFENSISARRSFRGITGPPLERSDIEELVSLAMTAPAPHHTTPWRFVVIDSKNRLNLAKNMGLKWKKDLQEDGTTNDVIQKALENSKRRIMTAPTLLLGCLVADGLTTYADTARAEAEWGLAQHSFGAALENLLLAAHTRDYGAYWISAPLYAQEAVRDSLDLDDAWQPQAFVAIGHKTLDYKPFERPPPDISNNLIWR
ncbi:MAG: 2-phospho-L-lactate guanylyltransferase [Chloroflexota bacterium]|nr:2-phospho-L-lactate guanylyltransferase [Chloroflexota bacterium]